MCRWSSGFHKIKSCQTRYNNRFYEHVQNIKGQTRRLIADAQVTKTGTETRLGVREESAPLTEAGLKKIKDKVSEELYNFLYLSVYLGLRPDEVEGLHDESRFKLEQKGELFVLWIFQTKLKSVEKDKCWKATRDAISVTEQTDTMLFITGKTGQGTQKITQEYIVHPNEFKKLGIGEAIYLAKSPNRYGKLKVRLQPAPKLSQALASMLGLQRARQEAGRLTGLTPAVYAYEERLAGAATQVKQTRRYKVFNFFNKTDSQVKQDVINEMNWDPSFSSSEVIVTANDGIVTLRGSVPHFIEKLSAEKAAQRVGGVRAVADELEVKGLFDKTDEEIARAALNALKWTYSVPADLKVAVEKGWLTLSGVVEWEFERNSARDAVKHLNGVLGVTNSITLRPKAQSYDIKTLIEAALKRSAESESRSVKVEVDGDTVTLSGNMHSYGEIEDARLAAWKAPGVMMVINNLVIAQ